jgi:hypothetical protein
MHIQPKFDPALLEANHQQQLEYFESQVIDHPHLVQSYNLALDCIEFSGPGEIVPIVGPTGVGTTELARRLWRHYREAPTTVDEDGQIVPVTSVIGLEAPSQAGRIDADYWKRLLAEILRRGGDVLIDRKIYVPPSQFILTHPIPYADPLKRGIDTLVGATANMLNRRQTQVVLINQADRLFPELDPAGCIRSQQVLMDLAAQTSARFVLIGDYRLARACGNRNNWLRRQNVVHFRRYDQNSLEESAEFSNALVELLAHIPLAQRPQSLSAPAAKQIYLSTVGCFGSVKRFLLQALQHAQRTGEEMTEDFLLEFAPPNVVALEIAKEALIGEQQLLDVDASEIERLLTLGKIQGSVGAGRDQDAGRTGAAKPPAVKRGNFGPARRVGERKPSRDPVGNRHGKKH